MTVNKMGRSEFESKVFSEYRSLCEQAKSISVERYDRAINETYADYIGVLTDEEVDFFSIFCVFDEPGAVEEARANKEEQSLEDSLLQAKYWLESIIRNKSRYEARDDG